MQLYEQKKAQLILKLRELPYDHFPSNMTRNEFGEKILKWIGKPDAILKRKLEIDDAEIARMKAVGTTKSMIEAWRDIYRNDFARNNNNYVGLARLRLMEEIIKKWKE